MVAANPSIPYVVNMNASRVWKQYCSKQRQGPSAVCVLKPQKLALAETDIVLHTQELLEIIQALEVYRPCLKGATLKTN